MKAAYYQELSHAVELDVIEKNPDGTLNLGRGETITIRSCPVSEEPKVGHAVLATTKAKTGKKTKAQLKAEAEALRAKADELSKAATAANSAAEAAPEDEAKAAAAEEAIAAAQEAEKAAREAEEALK